MGVTAEGKGKEALMEAANQAKKSTASLGKFQNRLPSKLEKKARINQQINLFSGCYNGMKSDSAKAKESQ